MSEEEIAQKPTAEEVQNQMEPLTLEQLTYHYGLMKLQLDRTVKTLNQLVEYVNNIHQNPAFVGGIIGHINDLTEQKQLLFIAVHQGLSEEDQKHCYRCTLNYILAGDDTGEKQRPEPHVTMETWDKGEDAWVTIIDDDPVQQVVRESVTARLVLMAAEETVPYYITIMAVDPTTMDSDKEETGE